MPSEPNDEAIRVPGVREALLAALADGSWSRYQGRHGAALQAALSELLDVPHVYPCCSGTFAVELGLRMLQIGPGDEVVLAGYDFAGNFRAIEAVGARPVLVDIVPGRWHLDLEQLAGLRSSNVKAIVVSHLHGALAPMKLICELAASRGWRVLEDACQATGAIVDGRSAGTWGDVGAFSFGGSKLLTAGRGGAVVTRNPVLLQRAKVFCEQGNHAFPLSELQAAVLLPQIRQLEALNAQRRRAVAQLANALAGLGGNDFLIAAPEPKGGDEPAYYKLGLLVAAPGAAEEAGRRQKIIDLLQAEGVAIDAGFRGFAHRSSARCRKFGDLPHATFAASATLVLHHSELLADDSELQLLAQRLAKAAAASQ
jgi:dTDP-4-amino-4,6-dideoxygalactose transaminase